MYMVVTTFVPDSRMAAEVVEVRSVRHVGDAVGAQGEQRVDVVGGGDAERFYAAQLACISAHLLG